MLLLDFKLNIVVVDKTKFILPIETTTVVLLLHSFICIHENKYYYTRISPYLTINYAGRRRGIFHSMIGLKKGIFWLYCLPILVGGGNFEYSMRGNVAIVLHNVGEHNT